MGLSWPREATEAPGTHRSIGLGHGKCELHFELLQLWSKHVKTGACCRDWPSSEKNKHHVSLSLGEIADPRPQARCKKHKSPRDDGLCEVNIINAGGIWDVVLENLKGET